VKVHARFRDKTVQQARRAFKKLPEVVQTRLGEATDKTRFIIEQKARARVRVRYGNLKNKITSRFSPKTGVGQVGIDKGSVTLPDGTVETPSRIAHLIEFGTQTAPAFPFMLPSVESEREPCLERCRAAGRHIEEDLKQ
jgi:hypothetical protein